MLQALDQVEIEALPAAIPAVIEVDVTSLTLEDSITVSDLPRWRASSIHPLDERSSPWLLLVPPRKRKRKCSRRGDDRARGCGCRSRGRRSGRLTFLPYGIQKAASASVLPDAAFFVLSTTVRLSRSPLPKTAWGRRPRRDAQFPGRWAPVLRPVLPTKPMASPGPTVCLVHRNLAQMPVAAIDANAVIQHDGIAPHGQRLRQDDDTGRRRRHRDADAGAGILAGVVAAQDAVIVAATDAEGTGRAYSGPNGRAKGARMANSGVTGHRPFAAILFPRRRGDPACRSSPAARKCSGSHSRRRRFQPSASAQQECRGPWCTPP